jgi:zinc transporter
MSDLTFEQESDPDEVGPLWCFVNRRLLVTVRTHPLKTTDELRAQMRRGMQMQNCYDLLAWIIGQRTRTVRNLATQMSERVGEIEDEILAGSIKQQREELGRIRRLCARLRRHLLPDRTGFHKLLQRRVGGWTEEDAENIRTESEELSFLIDDLSELYERAKLLQEELASRVAEDTGRSLYVIAILSAVFLPMTLVTGIFGMNVAGLPGLHEDAAFLWVMLVILLAGLATLGALFWRKRF